MKTRGRTVRHRGPFSAESDLRRSLDELDQAEPGWDDGVKLLGIARRLERDSSASGVQAAVNVYGEGPVLQAMPCADLRVVDGEVIGRDGEVRYHSREKVRSARRKRIGAVFGAAGQAMSDDEIELVHLLLFSESSISMVARELGVSEERLHAVTQGLFDMLNSPRRGTGAAEETHPALASLSRKLLLRA